MNGGWFTLSLISAMEADPDGNRDRFLSWEEVFVKARENTEKLFSQTTFTAEQQARMRQLGITSQTPKAYALPTNTTLTAGAFFTIDGLREVNLIFAAVVLGTLIISGRISRKLKKQYAGRDRIAAQRNKAWAILFIEVLIWIGFNALLGVLHGELVMDWHRWRCDNRYHPISEPQTVCLMDSPVLCSTCFGEHSYELSPLFLSR